MTLLDLLGPAAALASAAVEAEHEAHHAPSINDIWFPLGNFLIYAFILYKYALPAVRDFLASRRQQVLDTVQAASAKMRSAEAFVSEYKAKVAGLDKEIQAIDASVRQDGEREKVKLLEEAALLAKKIKDDGRFLGEQEIKMARQKVREEMADRAENQARQLIERNLTSSDQGRLVEEFIHSIGQSR